MGKYFFIIIIFILFSAAVQTVIAEVALSTLIEEENLGLQWEPYRKIGVIYRDSDRLLFRPGTDRMIVNYGAERIAGDITIKDGIITFSDTAATFVKSFFKEKELQQGPVIRAVVIDPGHGGRDPGTNHSHVIGDKKIYLVEKDLVLNVAKDLYYMMSRRYPAKQIVLTRDDDTYLRLEERVEIANSIELNTESEAIIFVSIHANASLNPKSYGYEVWYLPPEYGRKNLISESEAGENVRPILNMMKDEEFTIESILLGQRILDAFDGIIGENSLNRGLKEESWFVVRNARMPSVLIELGFVTNPEEALRMTEPEYLHRMAQGLYNGISGFIENFESN